MEQTLKEKSLEHEINSDAAPETPAAQPEQLDERIETAVRAASDKKAVNSLVLDLEKVADFTSFFLITSGTNLRQVQAIADGIEEELRKNGTRPTRIEGYNSAEWILLDYGDLIIHVFDQKQREFYDLERLWRDARRIPLPENI